MGMLVWEISFKLFVSDMCALPILYVNIKVTKCIEPLLSAR